MLGAVAEEVFDAPPAEHGMGDGCGVGVGPGGEDLGLVTAGGIEADDLAAGEVAGLGLVHVGDAHPAVGQQVAMVLPELVGEDVGDEGGAGLGDLGALAVGEDVKAGRDQLGEQRRAPSAAVKGNGGPGVGADQGPHLGGHPAQLAHQRRPRLGVPHQHPVTAGVGDPGVLLGGHGQTHAGQVRLGQTGFAVIGPHVAVGVEDPCRRLVSVHVTAGQRCEEVPRAALGGEARHPSAHGGDLRGTVQAEEAAQVGGVDPGQSLGPGLAHQGGEHHGEHQRGQAVEGGPGPRVHRGRSLDQAGGGQGGQDDQCPCQWQRRSLGDDRRSLGQRSRAGGLALVGPGQRRGQGLQDARRRGRDRRRGALAGQRPRDRVARNTGPGGDSVHRRASGPRLDDLGHLGLAQLRGTLRAPLGRDKRLHPTGRVVVSPCPRRHVGNSEGRHDLAVAGGTRIHELHRRQPTSHDVAGVPTPRCSSPKQHHTTRVDLKKLHPRRHRHRAGRSQRKGLPMLHTPHSNTIEHPS